MRKPGSAPMSIPPKAPSLMSGSEPHTGQWPWGEEPTTRRPHPGASNNAGCQSHATAARCVAVQNLGGSCQKHPHVDEDPKDNANTRTRLERRHGELRCRPPKPKVSQRAGVQLNGAVSSRSLLLRRSASRCAKCANGPGPERVKRGKRSQARHTSHIFVSL